MNCCRTRSGADRLVVECLEKFVTVRQQYLQQARPFDVGDGLSDEGFDFKDQKCIPILPGAGNAFDFRRGKLCGGSARLGCGFHFDLEVHLDCRLLHLDRTQSKRIDQAMNAPAFLRKKDERQEILHLFERGRKFNAHLVEVGMDMGLDEVQEVTGDGYGFAVDVIDA